MKPVRPHAKGLSGDGWGTRLTRPKVIAGVALSAALGASLLSGCGTAPYAATVNGEPISVQELGAHARSWASSPAFVKYQDSQFAAQEAEAEEEGESNVPSNTVLGNGTGPNVYGMYWTTLQLSNMITALALGQYLSAHRNLPSRVRLSAAWSAEWAENPTIWSEVGSSARSDGASYVAMRAQLVPATDAKTDESFYTSNKKYFWASVCVLTDDVSVVGSNGSVDMSASRSQAEGVAKTLAANPTSPPAAVDNGSHYCDTPEQLISGPASFASSVQALAPGQVALERESWGYQVLQVTSRRVIPFTDAIAAIIEIVTSGGGAQGQPNSETPVINVLKHSRIRVSPTFGSWATTLPSPYAPQVLPPGASA